MLDLLRSCDVDTARLLHELGSCGSIWLGMYCTCITELHSLNIFLGSSVPDSGKGIVSFNPLDSRG